MGDTTTNNTPVTDAAKKLAEIREHNRKARSVFNPTFKPLDKAAKVPDDEIGKGYLLVHPDNAELKFQLDILHVQRGDDKGMKYPGKRITPDNYEAFVEFFGVEYICARIDTAFNTENQRFALGSDNYKAITPETDLIAALTTRTVRGESKATLQNDLVEVAKEITKAIQSGDMAKAAELQGKLVEVTTKLAGK